MNESLIRPDDFKRRLLDVIKILADPEYQRRLWIENSVAGCVGSMDESVAQLESDLDARCFLDKHAAELGQFAVHVADLLNRIDAVYASPHLGNQVERLASPLWKDVVEVSQRIITMERSGTV